MLTTPLEQARKESAETPLNKIDVSDSARFGSNTHWPFFDRLRAEDQVHYCADSPFGPYWSITSYADIMTVDTSHKIFTSEDGIFIGDRDPNFVVRSFVTVDDPLHAKWCKPVMPAVGRERIDEIEALIHERAEAILNGLPRGETFDWVDRVAKELTLDLLVAVFDIPYEDRAKLLEWSNATTATDKVGDASMDMEERKRILGECVAYFSALWLERKEQPPKLDFVSLFAHHPDTTDLVKAPFDLMGNILLLIVGGNDTTRNAISGGLLVLNEFPDQYDKLIVNPDLIPNMCSEIIRWQTPLPSMRRTALQDFELGGKTIKAGDKVMTWYVSANRDAAKFDEPYQFRIDRENARSHMAYGFGVHRCMGNHVAEMQLRILSEKILAKFPKIEVVGDVECLTSNYVSGIEKMPVRIPT